ncbi:MAG: FAD-binding oxidoreductase [Pseudomonadota bacterium]
MTDASAAIDEIRAVLGPKGVLDGADRAPLLEEWRGRWRGETPLVVAPASTEDVARIVRLCADAGIAITPQGGNTGLVGGQIPFKDEILMTLRRMTRIREVDAAGGAMTVEAGVTVAAAQAAAADVDRLFPLSLGSEGTCQIGGVVSTNAGGVNVLRYGNMRDLVLGLEVVTAAGEIWNGLRALRKDNTGYDIKHLFIGAEGTLGIVTGAVLKLFPRPKETAVGWASVPSPGAAVDLLALVQDATGGLASSFEIIGRRGLELVLKNVPDTSDPLAQSPWSVLVELSAGEASGLAARLESALALGVEGALVSDATIARNDAQAAALWKLRHEMSAGMKPEGFAVKCDVSTAVSKTPDLIERADREVLRIAPGARIIAFGHIGDGNIHYDVCRPLDWTEERFRAVGDDIEQAVHDVVAALGGSISAEHGLGRLKRAENAARKSPVELAMQQAVKDALDPRGMMNPGKVL